MNWDALIFAVLCVAIGLRFEFMFSRIIGELENANETLASILESTEK